MKTYCLVFIAFLIGGNLYAQPNWSEYIAPIVYKNCAKCHHTGGIAPFSLMTYTDVYNMRSSVAGSVNAKRMPPWPPMTSYRHFKGERVLSSTEIQQITDWVQNGAPAGDLSKQPTPPIFNDNSQLNKIDVSVRMNPFSSLASSTDDYRCFVLPTNTTADAFVTAIEVIPGNPNAVHHVLVFQDTSKICRNLDTAQAGEGYTNFGGVGTNKAILLSAWVPGSSPKILPSGTGMRLYKNADIVIQVHYPKGSIGMLDSTRVNLTLSNSTSLRQVYFAPILNHQTNLQNGPLFIAANTSKEFTEKYTVPVDITAISVAPHMHLIGTSAKSFGVTPTGDTIPLINIPDWDFHWQDEYTFQKMLKIPAGTILYGKSIYNNTTTNVHNPSNPPIDVNVGEATTDEMMLTFFSFMQYKAGDENVILDSTFLSVNGAKNSTQNIQAFYNSETKNITLQIEDKSTDHNIVLIDATGRVVYTKEVSRSMSNIDCSSFEKGIYLLSVIDKNGATTSRKIILY